VGESGTETDGKKESVIYISDLATDKESPRTAHGLMKAFAESYKKHYTDTGRLIPIVASMREKTSYALVVKHIDQLSKMAGVQFTLIEKGTYSTGGDTMHNVVLMPVK
jgi:hypothetical protein